MSALEKWLCDNGFDADKAMNHLQAAGLVSDNCVSAADVAAADCARATAYILHRWPNSTAYRMRGKNAAGHFSRAGK